MKPTSKKNIFVSIPFFIGERKYRWKSVTPWKFFPARPWKMVVGRRSHPCFQVTFGAGFWRCFLSGTTVGSVISTWNLGCSGNKSGNFLITQNRIYSIYVIFIRIYILYIICWDMHYSLFQPDAYLPAGLLSNSKSWQIHLKWLNDWILQQWRFPMNGSMFYEIRVRCHLFFSNPNKLLQFHWLTCVLQYSLVSSDQSDPQNSLHLSGWMISQSVVSCNY